MILEYQLIRSVRRKTLSVQVKRGKLVVRAPAFLSVRKIDSFIEQKQAWLKTKISEQENYLSAITPLFTPGSKIWVKGRYKTLHIDYQIQSEVREELDIITVVIAHRVNKKITSEGQLADKVKQNLAQWYKTQAQDYLPERLQYLSEKLQLFPAEIKIRQYKARWGSCNNKGYINLNYFLMMLPAWIVDYVIIHELCHLVHLNHSRDFWLLVDKHCSDANHAKAWLKSHQSQLSWD